MDAGRGVSDLDPETIPRDLIRAQLGHILASRAFDASRRNRAFLRFVVEESLAGRADRIKAYTIATSVLGRDEAFDPQADPIVRIEASRLRRSLERYYLIAGQDDPVRIHIPKGGYVASFQRLQSVRDDCAFPHHAYAPEPGEEPPVLPEHHEVWTGRAGIFSLLTSRRLPARGAWAAVASGTVAIALGIGLWVSAAATEPESVVVEAAGRGPSIVVLPFENLSSEPAKAYLAGAITEEM
jgi:adenylate cyclase